MLFYRCLTDGCEIMMWQLRLWNVRDVAVFVSFSLYLCHLAGAISIDSPQRSLSKTVQEQVCFSVEVVCNGTPTIHWSFMSGVVSRSIAAWQPGKFTNITANYSGRVQAFRNGSMALSNLRLQDTGYYVITVTEAGGSSRDATFVLRVSEVLYEDLQYLSVSALALGCLAALLMLLMWLLNKVYRKVLVWRCRKRMPETDATELQPL